MKAFFAHSMHQSNCFSCIPTTWEFGSQSLLDLVRLLIAGDFYKITLAHDSRKEQNYLNQLHELATELCRSSSKQAAGGFRSQMYLSEIGQWMKSQTLPRLYELTQQTSISGNIWIVKAIGLSCGQSIHVCSGFVNVLHKLLALQGRCIVQKYIEKPLTVRGGFKFDIRQWVLVTSLSPIKIYGFSEFYLRVSSAPFSLSSESFVNPFVHLTNFAVQKHAISNSFAENVGDENFEEGSGTNDVLMMSMREFEEEVQSRFSSDIFHRLCADIQRVCLSGVLACVPHLDSSASSTGCFEWLGLDLMVDEQFQVSLIEINTSPDISYSTAITRRLVAAAITDMIPLLTSTDTNRSQPGTSCWNQWYPRIDWGDSQLFSRGTHDVALSSAHDNNQLNNSVYFRKSTTSPIVDAATMLLTTIQNKKLSLDCDATDQDFLENNGESEESEDEI